MEIKISNKKIKNDSIESLINHIIYYAIRTAKDYRADNDFYRGTFHVYHDVLCCIQRWGIDHQITWGKNLADWAEKFLQYPPRETPAKRSSLRIAINSDGADANEIKCLINILFSHAEDAAVNYDVNSDYQQGVGQAYSEVLVSIHNWGILENIRIDCNLDAWAEKHLA